MFARHTKLLFKSFKFGPRLSNLGQDFSVGLYQAEVDYLISREFAKSAEDIIWRRTRLGIRMNRE